MMYLGYIRAKCSKSECKKIGEKFLEWMRLEILLLGFLHFEGKQEY